MWCNVGWVNPNNNNSLPMNKADDDGNSVIQNGSRRRQRCHPDLGALACLNQGESCKKIVLADIAEDSYRFDQETEEGLEQGWYCIVDSEQMEERHGFHQQQLQEVKNEEGDENDVSSLVATSHRQLTIKEAKQRLWNGPGGRHRGRRNRESNGRFLQNDYPAPTGPIYDECSKNYEYDYSSTIYEPSGWDRCACNGYGEIGRAHV